MANSCNMSSSTVRGILKYTRTHTRTRTHTQIRVGSSSNISRIELSCKCAISVFEVDSVKIAGYIGMERLWGVGHRRGAWMWQWVFWLWRLICHGCAALRCVALFLTHCCTDVAAIVSCINHYHMTVTGTSHRWVACPSMELQTAWCGKCVCVGVCVAIETVNTLITQLSGRTAESIRNGKSFIESATQFVCILKLSYNSEKVFLKMSSSPPLWATRPLFTSVWLLLLDFCLFGGPSPSCRPPRWHLNYICVILRKRNFFIC